LLTFTNNSAESGGAMYICNSSYTLSEGNSTLILDDNKAAHGGALYSHTILQSRETPMLALVVIQLHKMEDAYLLIVAVQSCSHKFLYCIIPHYKMEP